VKYNKFFFLLASLALTIATLIPSIYELQSDLPHIYIWADPDINRKIQARYNVSNYIVCIMEKY
jgi:hypothetical protein